MKLIKELIRSILSEFKWYRMRKGGTWYFINKKTNRTPDGVYSGWTQTVKEGSTVLKEEKH